MDKYGRRGEPEPLIPCLECGVGTHPDGKEAHDSSSWCSVRSERRRMEVLGMVLVPDQHVTRLKLADLQMWYVKSGWSRGGWQQKDYGAFEEVWAPGWLAPLFEVAPFTLAKTSTGQLKEIIRRLGSGAQMEKDAGVSLTLLLGDESEI